MQYVEEGRTNIIEQYSKKIKREKPVLNDLKQMLLNTLEMEEE